MKENKVGNNYKTINSRANILLKKALASSLGVIVIYVSIYVIIFLILLSIFRDSIDIKYILSYIPSKMPVQSAILTALGALILSLFINVRTEIKDIDNISQNSQIKAVAYKKFAKFLVYIIDAILFSHAINNGYLYFFESKKIEEFDPPLYILIIFIFFMLFMVHLPGEYQISLEGQYEDALNKLARYEKNYMTKRELKITGYLSKIYSNDPRDNKCSFDKYLSKYSYEKAYLNYFAGCSGYLSFRRYVLMCLWCLIIFYLCLTVPMSLIYLDVFMGDLDLFGRILLRTSLLLLLLGLFTLFIIPGPQIIESFRDRSWNNLVIFCTIFIFLWMPITISYGIIIPKGLHDRRGMVGGYSLFELFIPILYIFLSPVFPILWSFFQWVLVKKVGKKVLKIPDLSTIDILYFAKLWNMWLIAKSIYEQEYIYRNSMGKNKEEESPKNDLEIDYSRLQKRYNMISDRIYGPIKSKNDNDTYLVFPESINR